MATTKMTPQTVTRIFPEAGHFILIKHKADRSDSSDPDEIYTSDAAIVDTINTKYALTTEDMNDGNSFDPAASHVTARDGTVDIVLNTFDMMLYAFLTGAKIETKESGSYISSPTGYTISTNGKVKLEGTLDANATFPVIVKCNGVAYEKVSSTPTAGQFSVDTDKSELTFNLSDAGKSVYVTCAYTTTSLTVATVDNKPQQYEYTAIITGKNCDKGETDELADYYIMDSVKVNGEVTMPQRGKSYSSWTVSLKLTSARPGKKAIEWGNATPSVKPA